MKNDISKRKSPKTLLPLIVLSGSILNVLFSYGVWHFHLPLWMDCVGTVCVSALGGVY